jgi:chemotaxis protein MotB
VALSHRRTRSQDQGYYWPGFVDAMAQLLLVITFLLSVFMIAQFLLAREITGQDTVLSRLRTQIAELTSLLALEKASKSELEITLTAITDDLKAARVQTARLQGLFDDQQSRTGTESARLAELQGEVARQRSLSADALAQVELLNQQIAALRRQIGALNEALEAAEARDQDSKTVIADLGRRLNAALAQRVQELTRYRSEFFGRLRRILSQRSDIRVVGDRFVFQSEVLFPKGSADISPAGVEELRKLATAMTELEGQIPPDIAWVLRVDGHTDNDPINTPQFRSNWELSSARAIAVVKSLIDLGITPAHLVAAGFGEFQPIDDLDTPEAKARNRRIELKLTER